MAEGRITWGAAPGAGGRRRCEGHSFACLSVDPDAPLAMEWFASNEETEVGEDGNVVEVTYSGYYVDLSFSGWVMPECPVGGENGFRKGKVALQFPGRLVDVQSDADLVAILQSAAPSGLIDGKACKFDFSWRWYPGVDVNNPPEDAVLIN